VVKCLLTSTFTAQAVEFQAQHYRRVGGFAALASGEDVDLPARSLPCCRLRAWLRLIGTSQRCRIRPIYHDAQEKISNPLEKRIGDKGVVGV
jgi:hypothetical protein